VYASGMQRGLARPPLGGAGGRNPLCGVPGAVPPNFFFCLGKCDTYLEKRVMYLGGFFGTWFLPMVFYFQLRN
jgi:hypothetical protein